MITVQLNLQVSENTKFRTCKVSGFIEAKLPVAKLPKITKRHKGTRIGYSAKPAVSDRSSKRSDT